MREGAKQQRAKELRRAMTDAELKLWRHLRDRRTLGWKFRRQHPIGPFIVDFVCLEIGVIVEADGGQHGETDRDACRDCYLSDRGFHVLRFWNHEILCETDVVLDRILVVLRQRTEAKFHILC
ncbi:MAG TPA: DUF559 domain-containing protein [Lysobacter sp.]|nr:DUF559 domain-containing protein [Lysobacter sp.]